MSLPGPALSSSPAARRRAALAGIALAVVACAFFALLDTTSKLVSVGVPIVMALWMRYVFQSLLTTAFVLQRAGRSALRTTQPRFQALRGALFAMTSLFGFISLTALPLAEFTAIVALTPLALTLLAALWLSQQVSPLRWVLVALGFAGTLVILRPGGGQFSGWALVWPALQLLANTAYQILSSRMAGKERPLTTQIYTSLLALSLSCMALPWSWQLPDSAALWLAAIAMGAGSAVGHLMLLKAYEKAEPATITPFLYSQIPCALLAGWLVYGHIPDQWAVLGMVVIALCGAASAWLSVREAK